MQFMEQFMAVGNLQKSGHVSCNCIVRKYSRLRNEKVKSNEAYTCGETTEKYMCMCSDGAVTGRDSAERVPLH
jgi:hypothetical protein